MEIPLWSEREQFESFSTRTREIVTQVNCKPCINAQTCIQSKQSLIRIGSFFSTHHPFKVLYTLYFISVLLVFNLPDCGSVGANTTRFYFNLLNTDGAIKLNTVDSDLSYGTLAGHAVKINQRTTNTLINYSDSFQQEITVERLKSLTMDRDEFYYGVFPSDFKWGVATSSYQTEGAWNQDGKGESIWDRFCHSDPKRIADSSNGDIACDSYHNFKEDIRLVKNMGAKVYRISISWARILPKGTTEKINQPGIDFYNTLINTLIAEGIEPMLTLFHWDLPQNLQEMGGWENEQLISIFGDYARICFSNFGDRVKTFITINEPYIFSILGYDWNLFAPGIKQPATSPYQVVHTLIKSHAVAYHIYKEEFGVKQKGKIGITVDCWWYQPANPANNDDVAAAERALQFRMGWVLGPIIKGDYPLVMRELIERHSKLENRSESRLPYFSPEWISKIKGSVDFIGLNHYTTELVKSRKISPTDKPSWSTDSETDRFQDPSWPSAKSPWLKIVPWGLRKLLNWMKNEYGSSMEIMITENGCSDQGALKDTMRVNYFNLYINEVLKAVKIDGCNVTCYLAWSLMDVFEWNVGYTEKFGIHHVDFGDPNRTRTPKDSAAALAKIFADNGFPHPKQKVSPTLSVGDSVTTT